jgi:hypothetical protein
VTVTGDGGWLDKVPFVRTPGPTKRQATRAEADKFKKNTDVQVRVGGQFYAVRGPSFVLWPLVTAMAAPLH